MQSCIRALPVCLEVESRIFVNSNHSYCSEHERWEKGISVCFYWAFLFLSVCCCSSCREGNCKNFIEAAGQHEGNHRSREELWVVMCPAASGCPKLEVLSLLGTSGSPTPLWSFFFGWMAASSPQVLGMCSWLAQVFVHGVVFEEGFLTSKISSSTCQRADNFLSLSFFFLPLWLVRS